MLTGVSSDVPGYESSLKMMSANICNRHNN